LGAAHFYVIWQKPPLLTIVAEVVFSENALLHVRAMSATLPWAQPVVSVVWVKATMDNSRGINGKVEWRAVDEPKWFAFVSDWGDIANLDVDPDSLPQVEGVVVYQDKKAEAERGKFTISLTERGLAVELSAT
jgi:hypothetical protein